MSSYFYRCARLKSPDKYADARVAIADVFQSNHRCYDYRWPRAALGRRQMFISEKVVQRLMKQECLVVAANRRRRYGSCFGEISPAPENLTNRRIRLQPRMSREPHSKSCSTPGWSRRPCRVGPPPR